jgi:hypothetical protein
MLRAERKSKEVNDINTLATKLIGMRTHGNLIKKVQELMPKYGGFKACKMLVTS